MKIKITFIIERPGEVFNAREETLAKRTLTEIKQIFLNNGIIVREVKIDEVKLES